VDAIGAGSMPPRNYIAVASQREADKDEIKRLEAWKVWSSLGNRSRRYEAAAEKRRNTVRPDRGWWSLRVSRGSGRRCPGQFREEEGLNRSVVLAADEVGGGRQGTA
jgi:hypothetical protein